jgi:hypothetical protein
MRKFKRLYVSRTEYEDLEDRMALMQETNRRNVEDLNAERDERRRVANELVKERIRTEVLERALGIESTRNSPHNAQCYEDDCANHSGENDDQS